MLINRKAVMADQARRFVYVVGDDNTVARRAVVTGREVHDLIVVREGLKSGDRVIVNGTQKVFAPGQPVAPNPIAMVRPPAPVKSPTADPRFRHLTPGT